MTSHEELAAATRGDRYPKDIDIAFIRYLDRINAVPGLQTVYCCTDNGFDMAYVSININRDFEEIFAAVAPVCLEYENKAFYSTISGWENITTPVWTFHYSCSFFDEFTEKLTVALETLNRK